MKSLMLGLAAAAGLALALSAPSASLADSASPAPSMTKATTAHVGPSAIGLKETYTCGARVAAYDDVGIAQKHTSFDNGANVAIIVPDAPIMAAVDKVDIGNTAVGTEESGMSGANIGMTSAANADDGPGGGGKYAVLPAS